MWVVTYTTQIITSDEGESMVKEYLVYDEGANQFARNKAFIRMKALSAISGIDHNDFKDRSGIIDFEEWGKAIAKGEIPAAIVTVKDGDFTRITATFSNEDIRKGMEAEAKENEMMMETINRMHGEND